MPLETFRLSHLAQSKALIVQYCSQQVSPSRKDKYDLLKGIAKSNSY
jgi:hypothetical protein